MDSPDRSLPLALWVLGAGDIAGVGRHALDVAGHGVPGWRVEFLVEEGPLAADLRGIGAVVTELPGPFGKHTGTARSLTTFRRVVRQQQPDLVHSHLSWADVVAGLGLVRSPVPAVTTEHGIADVKGLYNARMRGDLMRQLHRWRLRRTAGIIAVSRATRRSMTTQWGPLVAPVQTVQPNGAGVLAAVDQPPRQGLRVGLLARLAPEKRVDLAVRAFAAVHRQRPDSRLLLGGSGPLEPELRALVRQLGLDQVVTFLGYVRPVDFWPEVDVLVQLSAWENCSYSLLDGLRLGRGIVATDVGGNGEFLPPAALVGPSPTTEEVATAILGQEHSSYGLPAGWPTVGEMTEGIAKVYDEVMALGVRSLPPRPVPLAKEGEL